MTKTSTPIKVKDHSVSQEDFFLKPNKQGDILITSPQPSEEEIGKYYDSEDYISHTDARRSVFEKVYHKIRTYSLKKKVGLIENYSGENSNLLDIGCGTGDFLSASKNRGWNVWGIEPNDFARELAEQKSEIKILSSTKELPELNTKFQLITLWHVLEHLHNLEDQIELMTAKLNPSGRLVIAVPNFRSFDAGHYKEYWAAYDVPRHLWHFSREGLTRILKKHGMVLEDTHPMLFDSYYVSLLSEKYKSGWMNIFKAFIIGTWSNLKARSTGEYSSIIYVFKKGENLK